MKKLLIVVAVVALMMSVALPARAGGGEYGKNVVVSILTVPLKIVAFPVQATARIVENGGSPLRWINSAVRQGKESFCDIVEDGVRVPLALVGAAEPVDIQDVGVVTQGIRDAGPGAEFVTDTIFTFGVTAALQGFDVINLFDWHNDSMWAAAGGCVAGMGVASQLIDPSEEDVLAPTVKKDLGKLERHGTDARRVIAKK